MSWNETIDPLGPAISQSASAVLSSNLQISKAYPAVQLLPTEANSLELDITEVGGDTFWTQNLTYNASASQWQLVKSSIVGYGMVLRANGHFQLITLPANSAPGTPFTIYFEIDNTGKIISGVAGNITTQKAYPAVQLLPTETSGRELDITEVGGDTFWTVNLTYNTGSSQWQLVQSSLAGYGMALRANGHFQLLTVPANSPSGTAFTILFETDNTGAIITTPNITTAGALTAGSITTSGAIASGSITATGNVSASGNISASGTLQVGNPDYLQLSAATGNPGTITCSALGTDANIGLNLVSKGTGTVQANGNPVLTTASAYVSQIIAGSGISISPTGGTGAVTVSSTSTVKVPSVQAFGSGSGTYNPSSGTRFIKVTLVGGGGGGAGTQLGAAAGGGGGGAGGTVIWYITSPGSYSYSVGSGGGGGAVGYNSGGGGGNTTFGSATAYGGGGGSRDGPGGSGGGTSGGSFGFAGGSGGPGNSTSGGDGGTGIFGGAGGGGYSSTNGSSASGLTGAGGGGGGTNASTSTAGGNGAGGIIIVEEY